LHLAFELFCLTFRIFLKSITYVNDSSFKKVSCKIYGKEVVKVNSYNKNWRAQDKEDENMPVEKHKYMSGFDG